MNIEEEISPRPILSQTETNEVIDTIKSYLQSGNTNGSGKFRFGVIGDIENILGWHGKDSPQTPLTQDMRLSILINLKQLVMQYGFTEMQEVTRWLVGRVNDLTINKIKKVIALNGPFPDATRDQALHLIGEIKQIEQEMENIQGIEVIHDKTLMSSMYYSDEQKAQFSTLNDSVNEKKMELLGLLK